MSSGYSMSVLFPHILNDAISSEYDVFGLSESEKYKKTVAATATMMIVATVTALKLPSAI
ncbi:MAG: hypothetical protein ACFFCX_00125 [Candidatus Sifarchaeia archaeon]